MSNSPGLYIDIGKKARDLLYKDYGDKQPANHFRYDCVDSNFDVSCQCDAIVPGLSTAFRSIIPDSGGVELRYLHDYAGFTAGIGLKAGRHNHLQSVGLDRIVKFSVVAGNTVLSLGTDAAFDISTRTFSNYSAGLSFNTALFNASVNLNDKLENLRASYYQELVPLTRTAVAAELTHSFSNHRSISDNIPIPTSLTVGFQHGLFPSTLVKVRVNTNGKVGAHVQQSFWQKFSIAVSGETDIRASSWTPNVRFECPWGIKTAEDVEGPQFPSRCRSLVPNTLLLRSSFKYILCRGSWSTDRESQHTVGGEQYHALISVHRKFNLLCPLVDVENEPIEIHFRVENTILPDNEAPTDSLLVLTVTSHALGRTIFQDKVNDCGMLSLKGGIVEFLGHVLSAWTRVMAMSCERRQLWLENSRNAEIADFVVVKVDSKWENSKLKRKEKIGSLSPTLKNHYESPWIQVELRYMRDYAGITAGIGLKANYNPAIGVGFALDPITNFLGVIGDTLLSIGTNVAFDVLTGTLSNYNADAIPTTLTVGTQHELFPSTLAKARINTDGKELLLSRNLSGKECR
ncbi:mitochondrial outer membrane protein porin 1 [Citrus sinensis]|uniref:Mitochondrial outer membrane protein porin 1 n=1 Tax=Citrus sinensis TaxID=2711 RepID=A0ACB8LQZ2_CITSI|nr:mitochondrial outer membrane protein porin 1 [Citrus sinensis]